MFAIYVNGREVAIKSGSSFDFVFENPLFSDADSYTLDITFPLKDCPGNVAVFGNLCRPGADVSPRPFDMKIVAGASVREGCGLVTGFTEAEVKVQFLGQMSAINYDSDLDEIYIHELELGSVPPDWRNSDQVTVAEAAQGYAFGVAIPWVNESSGNLQNRISKKSVPYSWVNSDPDADPSDPFPLSWMPFLIHIAKQICFAIGYGFDFSAWEASKYKYLLLCNCVPGVWGHDWNLLLPGWSVVEFFRNLEPILEGYFDIDQVRKKVFFRSYVSCMEADPVRIDDVFDEFESDVFEGSDRECKYIPDRYLGYNFPDDYIFRYYSCPDVFADPGFSRYVKEFGSVSEFFETAKENTKYYRTVTHRRGAAGDYVYRMRAEDRYVALRYVSVPLVYGVSRQLSTCQSCNLFAPRNYPSKKKDRDSVDLSMPIYPVKLLEANGWTRVPFISCGSTDGDSDSGDNGPIDVEDFDASESEERYRGYFGKRVEEGEKAQDANFSALQIAFYPPDTPLQTPLIDWLHFEGFSAQRFDRQWTLSLRDEDGKFAGLPRVDTSVRYNFSFLADRVPDPTAMFLIKGRRYLCQSLTASAGEHGFSQRFKGVFWRVRD